MPQRAYTLSNLIDDLRAIYAEHGDIDVLDGKHRPLLPRHVELVDVDDWTNTTQTDDGEIPGKAKALSIGRGF